MTSAQADFGAFCAHFPRLRPGPVNREAES